MSKVCNIVIGTAGLGLNYGTPSSIKKPIGTKEAVDFIKYAYNKGIYIFDTAPAYGDSELKLGEALGDDGEIWTKCGAHETDLKEISSSIEKSFINLKKSEIFNVQWHSWTPQISKNNDFLNVWNDVRNNSSIKNVGASTYGVENAIAAVTSGLFDIVQVEWNVLNQRVINSIYEAAKERGVKIAARSILLKGLLTTNAKIPLSLRPLKPFIENAKKHALSLGLSIEEFAIAAALSNKEADYVIIGVSNIDHLDIIIKIVDNDISIDSEELRHLDCSYLDIIDPRIW